MSDQPSAREQLRVAFLTNAEHLADHAKLADFIAGLEEALKKINKPERLRTVAKHFKHATTEVEAKEAMLEGVVSLQDVVECKPDVFSRKQGTLMRQQEEDILSRVDSDYWKKKKQEIHSEGKGITCRFCKKPTASVTNMMQIRASDEPMTIFYQCYSCDKKWK